MNLTKEDLKDIVEKVANSKRVSTSHIPLTNCMGKGVWAVKSMREDVSDLKGEILEQAVFVPQDSIEMLLNIDIEVPDYDPREKGYIVILRDLHIKSGSSFVLGVHSSMIDFIVGSVG